MPEYLRSAPLAHSQDIKPLYNMIDVTERSGRQTFASLYTPARLAVVPIRNHIAFYRSSTVHPTAHILPAPHRPSITSTALICYFATLSNVVAGPVKRTLINPYMGITPLLTNPYMGITSLLTNLGNV